jgi:hypothetical protein
MPWNVFKEIKVRCDDCQAIIISKSETEWTECPCGNTKVMGHKNFMRISGDNCTDLSALDFDNVPEHRDWDAKPGDYTPPSEI